MDVREKLCSMQSCIQDALDELSSPRSSANAKTKALEDLEHQLALACLKGPNALNHFNSLQCTFDSNVPLRLLAWTSATTPKLDALTNKGVVDRGREVDVSELVSQLSAALFIIQGIALIHRASKVYLGRNHALEILLDLLLVSRHVTSPTKDPSSLSPPLSSSLQGLPHQQHLSSVVLDSLLCILVDSPDSLRSFENVNGVQLVVKFLKRAGTPREVRMKCLEFLYFYLMDETPKTNGNPEICIPLEPVLPPTAPATPIRGPKKPYLTRTPLHPSTRQPSSTSSLFPTPASPAISLGSSHSSRSSSNSSTASLSAASTAASSVPSSPETTSILPANSPKASSSTPATSPLTHRHHQREQVRSPPPVSLVQVKSAQGKETDSTPSSPVKRRYVASSLLRSGVSRHAPSKSMSAIVDIKVSSSAAPRSAKPGINKSWSEELQPPTSSSINNIKEGNMKGLLPRLSLNQAGSEKIKSTEEKKELLGTMLGNVDALVESVRKAGIWGLN